MHACLAVTWTKAAGLHHCHRYLVLANTFGKGAGFARSNSCFACRAVAALAGSVVLRRCSASTRCSSQNQLSLVYSSRHRRAGFRSYFLSFTASCPGVTRSFCRSHGVQQTGTPSHNRRPDVPVKGAGRGKGSSVRGLSPPSVGLGSGKARGKGNAVDEGAHAGLIAAVRGIEAVARSLEGRTLKHVMINPATAQRAQDFTAALAEGCQPHSLAASSAVELVRAASAFSRLRVLHTPLLRVLRNIPVETWRMLPAASVVDAIVAHACLQVEDNLLFQRWADLLDDRVLQGVSQGELVDLVHAVATLQVGRFSDLVNCLTSAAEKLDVRQLTWHQLARLSWGLGKIARFKVPYDGQFQVTWVERVAGALQSKRPMVVQSLGQLVWAFKDVGKTSVVQSLLNLTQGKALGRDAYTEMLRDATRLEQVAVFERMASHCTSNGLRAAIMNAAVIRCLEDGSFAHARELLHMMAKECLWNPVTYSLVDRLQVAQDTGPALEGCPPFPGLVDPGIGSHKYVRAAYYALAHGSPGDPKTLLAALEEYSQRKGWLKFGAADEKGRVIDDAIRQLMNRGMEPIAVEFGTFLGYATMRMARLLGPDAHIVTFEIDPEVACLAMNLIAYARLDTIIDVCVGHCNDLAPTIVNKLGRQSVSLVYMDHNQITYHQDLEQLESLGVFANGGLLVATQALKPGAPLLLWQLAEAQKSRHCELEIVSAPDCGCPMMEDWVVLATFHAEAAVWGSKCQEHPYELALLAVECNLMRWRTAKGLVNEHCWNGFVQHVRREMERIAGITSTRDAWPDPAIRERARTLVHKKMDY